VSFFHYNIENFRFFRSKYSIYIQAGMWKIFAGLSFAIVNSIIKSINLPVLEVGFFQNIFGSLFLFTCVKPSFSYFFKGNIYILRSVFSLAGILLWIYSIKNLPLLQVVSLGFLGPIITSMGACIIFNETIGKKKAIAIFLGTLGGVLIANGQKFGQTCFYQNIFYILPPIFAALAFSGSSLMAKYLVNKDSPQDVAFYLMISMSTILLSSIFWWEIPSYYQILKLIFLGFSTASAYFCMNKAYSIAEMTFLLPLGSFRLVISALLGWIVFSEIPNKFVILGTVIVIAAIFVLSDSVKNRKAVI
jgi:drug/metabolite transporter (DMT)-like permease